PRMVCRREPVLVSAIFNSPPSGGVASRVPSCAPDKRGRRPRMPHMTRHLDPCAQQLSDAPSLSDTTTRGERWIGVEYLTHRSDARFVEMGDEAFDHPLGGSLVIRIYLQPRIDEWTDQPCPHGPLVVGCVASAKIAVIPRLEIGIIRGERSQAERRQQPAAYRTQDRSPTLALQHLVR